MSNNRIVKLRRKEVAACITCPICNKLLRDATTIPECLHTFCRKCIYKKLTDEELECCPICNIDLGCVPLEKLRPDHNMQDVIGKIFPSKRTRVKDSAMLLPLRRKERSLSSLVVDTPRVSPQTGKRSKVPQRKKQHPSPLKKDDDMEDSSSSCDKVGCSDEETENGNRLDEWKPLNYLVEVANRSKSKGKDEHEFQDADSDTTAKPKKTIRKTHKFKAGVAGGKRVNHPIWFHLVPSKQQEESLGQIEGSFVRLKDGNIPVSLIQKLVMTKLQLGSEHEVELRCMGEPLVPTVLVGNLMDQWLQKQVTAQKLSVMAGSSAAKEYIMEISYATKVT